MICGAAWWPILELLSVCNSFVDILQQQDLLEQFRNQKGQFNRGAAGPFLVVAKFGVVVVLWWFVVFCGVAICGLLWWWRCGWSWRPWSSALGAVFAGGRLCRCGCSGAWRCDLMALVARWFCLCGRLLSRSVVDCYVGLRCGFVVLVCGRWRGMAASVDDAMCFRGLLLHFVRNAHAIVSSRPPIGFNQLPAARVCGGRRSRTHRRELFFVISQW